MRRCAPFSRFGVTRVVLVMVRGAVGPERAAGSRVRVGEGYLLTPMPLKMFSVDSVADYPPMSGPRAAPGVPHRAHARVIVPIDVPVAHVSWVPRRISPRRDCLLAAASSPLGRGKVLTDGLSKRLRVVVEVIEGLVLRQFPRYAVSELSELFRLFNEFGCLYA